VWLSTKKFTLAYIPGTGTTPLSAHSVVLIRGGRVPDLPGVKYRCIRNVEDLKYDERVTRQQRRSKFGVTREHAIKYRHLID
jgi:small subunit ribosomal protein S12